MFLLTHLPFLLKGDKIPAVKRHLGSQAVNMSLHEAWHGYFSLCFSHKTIEMFICDKLNHVMLEKSKVCRLTEDCQLHNDT